MTKLPGFLKHLRPGKVYRRKVLAKWSNAVDRDLKQLVEAGRLKKVSGGMYYRPKKSVFGDVPPEAKEAVRAFVKGDRFLLTSPNQYNGLGVGTTQLYNKTVVYNYKRHGPLKLGGQTFEFQKRAAFPSKLSKEFLLVDLVNNINRLAEDRDAVLERVKEKALSFDVRHLKNAVNKYGFEHTKAFFAPMLAQARVRQIVMASQHAA